MLYHGSKTTLICCCFILRAAGPSFARTTLKGPSGICDEEGSYVICWLGFPLWLHKAVATKIGTWNTAMHFWLSNVSLFSHHESYLRGTNLASKYVHATFSYLCRSSLYCHFLLRMRVCIYGLPCRPSVYPIFGLWPLFSRRHHARVGHLFRFPPFPLMRTILCASDGSKTWILPGYQSSQNRNKQQSNIQKGSERNRNLVSV